MSRERTKAPRGNAVADTSKRETPGRSTPSAKRYAGVPAPVLRRKASSPAPAPSGDAALNIAQRGFEGQTSPLPHRSGIEAAFGVSLGDVRAHVGPQASEANRALQSEAYTYGTNIAFRDSSPSRATVAHEVTHVLQQTSGSASSEAADEAQAHQAESAVTRQPMLRSRSGAVQPKLRFLKVRKDVDQGKLVKAGGADKLLDADKVTAAIKYNDTKWKGSYRTQVLSWLRNGKVAEGSSFSEADVQKAAKIQKGAGSTGKDIDGKIGDSSMAIFLHAGLTIAEDKKVKASTVTLLFYPGEFENIKAWEKAKQDAHKRDGHKPNFNEYRSTFEPDGTGRLYVKIGGTLVAAYDARGGPAVKLKDGSHTADPSAAGRYRLSGGGPHRTNSWYNSQIRWGAEIRKRADGEIEFKDPGSKTWKVATGDDCKLATPMDPSDFVKSDGSLMKTWDKNDFGANAWSVGARGMYVHTTPRDEHQVLAGKTPELSASHGCIHINPAERNEMMAKGYLQAGVKFIIKKYDAHLMPAPMRKAATTPKP